MKIDLTEKEALLLDGKVSEEAQVLVNLAKRRINMTFHYPKIPNAWIIADIVHEAETNGELIFHHKKTRFCKLCKKSGTYAKYKRDSRHHRKGDDNYDKPIDLPGIELAKRFVTMEGYPSLGFCSDCWKVLEKPIKDALKMVKAQLPEKLKGEKTYKKYSKMHCKKCDWHGHEGEMGRLRTVMGDGSYPGKCPECGAENKPFGATYIKPEKGFVVKEMTL